MIYSHEPRRGEGALQTNLTLTISGKWAGTTGGIIGGNLFIEGKHANKNE